MAKKVFAHIMNKLSSIYKYYIHVLTTIEKGYLFIFQ